jgi:excisionase family DNA binding protein
MKTDESLFLKPSRFAHLTDIAIGTVYKLLKSCALPVVFLDGDKLMRIPRAVLDAYLARAQVGSAVIDKPEPTAPVINKKIAAIAKRN